MKASNSILFLAAMMAYVGVAKAAPVPPVLAEPTKIPAAYTESYIPMGYDSNDSVEVVLEGRFSSSCWRPADVTVAVDHDKREVYVGPAAYNYPGRLCAQMILPYNRTVGLGILKPGSYSIMQATDGAKLGVVQVKAATSESPDDYLYAPVSQAFFRDKGASGQLVIAGSFPNSCMMLESVKIDLQPKVIAVQPIAKIQKRRDCKDGSFPFYNVSMVNFIQKGRYLLHVRSMNATSINSLVDIQ